MGTTETKPALKTSEFWIHAALQIFFLLDTLKVYDYVPQRYSGIVQAVMAAAYMISRGTAKAGTSPIIATTVDSGSDPATFPTE